MIAGIEEGAASLLEFLHRHVENAIRWQARVLDETTSERRVVEYTFSYADGTSPASEWPPRRLIGKFYSDQSGRAAFENMRAVRSALERASETPLLAVPDALYYDDEIRFLVQTFAPGTPYPVLVRHHGSSTYFAAAGRALAQLHALDLVGDSVTTLSDHIAELVRPHPMQLAERFPEYLPRIEHCLGWLLAEQARWNGQITPTPIHRDFQLRQLFYEQPRVWLIDWDLFATGDPAFDVAYFLVYLRTHLPQGGREAGVDAFLSGYLEHGSAEVLARLPCYEAFNYLRRACRRFRLQDDRWEQQMHQMLQRIDDC